MRAMCVAVLLEGDCGRLQYHVRRIPNQQVPWAECAGGKHYLLHNSLIVHEVMQWLIEVTQCCDACSEASHMQR